MYAELVKALVDGRQLKCYVQTFGCQQNEADSERLAGMAVDMGYTLTGTPGEADLIVVNTCAIREHAEKKALSLIGQYKHCKEEKESLVIAVCGCMPSQEHRADDIKHKYPYVDFTFGTSDLYMFPELLYRRLTGAKRTFIIPESMPPIVEDIPVVRESNYRAWVSIMYGCNNFCSYCIVPYVRGRERSRRPEAIEAEVRELVEAGYKDITLLGQNVNSYGRGCDFNCDFADLLERLATIEGDYKLHFMTSHPKDATKKLVDVMASSPHIARQFHLPLQSGSTAVLKAMNRGYTAEKYLQIVAYIKEKLPDVTLSTDIIVAFPGETDEDFEKTLEVLSKVRYDMVYSFIFSPRNGTPAAKMTNVIPEDVKSDRMRRLLDLQTEIADELNTACLGKTYRVLCQGASKNNPSMLEGRTEGNKIILFASETAREGDFVNVVVTETHAFALYGEEV
ncbi:MAG: tRNA (N6-isopentenyl adenosine(37)-C2)-methylthiotransferase MiaB [Eubacteriales bacterium]